MVKDIDTKFSGTAPDQLELRESLWGDHLIVGVTPSQVVENIGEYASHRFSVDTIDEGVAVPDLEVEKRTVIVLAVPD